ncbi:MAG: DUF6424 family protein, partial [Limisphaerales bacterium]
MSFPLAMQMHQEREDDPWGINIPDHVARTDSAGFRASKKLAKTILASLGADAGFFGLGNVQMHHGGSLWLLDESGWFIVQNEAGIEWSAQFCTDPAKADALRRNAQRVYSGFPKAIPEMLRLGYHAADDILNAPISDAAGVATWVDSIFNSCVPLPALRHVGQLPRGGGRHHYPAPITDIDLVKYDDFVLWVTDPQSHTPAAVVPVAPRGAGVNRVRVAWATPGTALHDRREKLRAEGNALETG